MAIRRLMLSIFVMCTVAIAFGQIGAPISWPQHNWHPPLPVPEVYAMPGAYSCQTVPNAATLAVIGCSPPTFGTFPIFALVFLRVHEYGHVNQLASNPSVYYSPYGEYDADCYAGASLVNSDPQILQQTILWLWNMVGPGFKDMTHGSGYETAQRLLQCARSQNPTFMADAGPGRDVLASSVAREPQPVRVRLANYQNNPAVPPPPQHIPEQPIPQTNRADDLDKETDEKGPPPFCTALDLLIDSAHSRFWEVSTKTGAIRPSIQQALTASCVVSPLNREAVTCKFDSRAEAKSPREQVQNCLGTSEWIRKCSDQKCNSETFTHPGDAGKHTNLTFSVGANQLVVTSVPDTHTVHESHADVKPKRNATAPH